MDKKLLITIIICIALCFCVGVICDTYKTNSTTNKDIELKLDSLRELILYDENSIIVYKDIMTNEVAQIDYITNDSAIILFRELVNEPSSHGEFSRR